MIEHISLMVKNYEESRRFYDETLSILGYERLMNFEDVSSKVCGYGKEGKPSFWISFEENPSKPDEKIGLASGFHVAFYAAFIIDPNGWRLEALYHDLSKVQ
jgi:catechol 2,3-dioxygenase-like lactoylglutathione lyase family enzyme